MTNTSIFHAYDIRGKYPEELNEETAYAIGRAVVCHLACKELRIGRDCRLSSPKLHAAFISGVQDQGCTVIDIGLCSTPLLYFASKKSPAAMITASHLPPEYNGIKLCKKNAEPIGSETGLREIQDLFTKKQFKPVKKKGTLHHDNILPDYIKHCMTFAKHIKPFTIVVDAGNGMGGITCAEVFKHLPCTLIPLYFEPNGTFPNHEANPLKPENMRDLQNAVKKHHADLGVAFDADADRILLVDEQGNIISGDKILGLLAQNLLHTTKNATILYDLRATRALPEFITKHGGKPLQTRVGHAFIKQAMRQHNAHIGGELSGHFYFKENNFAESTDITLLMILNLLSREEKKLSKLVQPLKTRAHSGEKSYAVPNTKETLQKLEQAFPTAHVDRLDGITLTFDTWWFNARPSQTEPVLRLVVEANTQQELKARIQALEKIII